MVVSFVGRPENAGEDGKGGNPVLKHPLYRLSPAAWKKCQVVRRGVGTGGNLTNLLPIQAATRRVSADAVWLPHWAGCACHLRRPGRNLASRPRTSVFGRRKIPQAVVLF